MSRGHVGVIDGMGSGIGAQIVTQLRRELPPEIEIVALSNRETVAFDKFGGVC